MVSPKLMFNPHFIGITIEPRTIGLDRLKYQLQNGNVEALKVELNYGSTGSVVVYIHLKLT